MNHQFGEWSVETLKEYIDQRFIDNDKAVSAAMSSTREAILKAENATEKRFEGVNEFRSTLADQATRLMPRAEFQVAHQSMMEKLESLKDSFNKHEALSKGSEITIGKIYAAIGFSSALFAFIVGILQFLGKT